MKIRWVCEAQKRTDRRTVHDDASCRCSESLCELPGIKTHL